MYSHDMMRAVMRRKVTVQLTSAPLSLAGQNMDLVFDQLDAFGMGGGWDWRKR